MPFGSNDKIETPLSSFQDAAVFILTFLSLYILMLLPPEGRQDSIGTFQ